MIRLLKICIGLATFCIVFFVAPKALAAGCTASGNCYWVGGTGSINDTAHWATTSGGATTGGLPSATDNCIFDTLSNATAYTVDSNATWTCLSLTVSAPATGDMTLDGTATVTLSANMTLYATMVNSYEGLVTFNATSTGQTITSAGVVFNQTGFTFNGIGGQWVLQDNLNLTAGNITLTAGELKTNGKTVTFGTMSGSGSTTRALDLDASTINCTENWNLTTTTNLTFSADTSTINMTGATPAFNGGGLTYNVVNITGSTSSTTLPSISQSNTFATLTRTSTAGYNVLILGGNQTVTGTLTFAGTSSTSARLYIGSDTPGTPRTITGTGATITLTHVDFEDITANGGTWTSSTNLGDCGGNTGITTAAPVTTYWVHGSVASIPLTNSGRWFTTSGGSTLSRMPLCQDNGKMDANSFGSSGKTVTTTTPSVRIGTLNWSGANNSPVFNIGSIRIYGSLTIDVAGGMTTTNSGEIVFEGRGLYTLTSAGQLAANDVTLTAPTGTLTFQDALTTSGNVTVNNGTLDTGANYTLTVSHFISLATSIRGANLNVSIVNLTGTATSWSLLLPTNFTLNAGDSTIKSTNNSSTNKTFDGGNLAYANFWNATQGTGRVLITGNNSFKDFKVDPGRNQRFTQLTTNVVSSLTTTGTAGNLITFASVASSSFTVTKSSAGTSCNDYMLIKYSNVTPGSIFYAGANSSNEGNNSGWTFTVCPSASTGNNYIIDEE